MGRRWLALKKTLSALIVHRRATAAGIVHRDIELLRRVCIWTRRCDTATSAEGESKDDSSSGVGWLNDRLQRRQPESAENLVTGHPGDPTHSSDEDERVDYVSMQRQQLRQERADTHAGQKNRTKA
jgi:hypothetical protein